VVSPDGREFVGNVGGVRMYRYAVSGGTGHPLPLEVNPSSNVVWMRDGALLVSASTDIGRGIAKLDAEGNVTRPLGTAHADLLLKEALPDNRSVLAIRQPLGAGDGPAILLDLETKDARVLIDRPFIDIRYTSGYLVTVSQAGSLDAVPFDARACA
jgi:hypothetical protein